MAADGVWDNTPPANHATAARGAKPPALTPRTRLHPAGRPASPAPLPPEGERSTVVVGAGLRACPGPMSALSQSETDGALRARAGAEACPYDAAGRSEPCSEGLSESARGFEPRAAGHERSIKETTHLALTRRAFLAAGLLLAGGSGSSRAAAEEADLTIEEIANVAATTRAEPLFMGLAHLILQPGAQTEAVNTVGPRIIALTSGRLTVGTAGAGTAFRNPDNDPTGFPQARPPRPVAPGEEVILEPGDRVALEPGAVREIRNDGPTPAVYLDAALFPPGPDPVPAAFTTVDGISFQLLVGATLDPPPAGTLEFALSRAELGPRAAWPATARDGPAAVYVESGSLALTPTAGAVRFSRAAAPAPYSQPAPMRDVPIGSNVRLTAGAAALLPTGSAVDARNERRVAARLLVVEVRSLRPADPATPAAA